MRLERIPAATARDEEPVERTATAAPTAPARAPAPVPAPASPPASRSAGGGCGAPGFECSAKSEGRGRAAQLAVLAAGFGGAKGSVDGRSRTCRSICGNAISMPRSRNSLTMERCSSLTISQRSRSWFT